MIRGEFLLPHLSHQATVSLLPKNLCEEQTIYVNGKRITGKIPRDDAVQEYSLAPSILHEGKNILALVGKPLVKRFLYDNLNTDPGIVQTTKPADQWRRTIFISSAFNPRRMSIGQKSIKIGMRMAINTSA